MKNNISVQWQTITETEYNITLKLIISITFCTPEAQQHSDPKGILEQQNVYDLADQEIKPKFHIHAKQDERCPSFESFHNVKAKAPNSLSYAQ